MEISLKKGGGELSYRIHLRTDQWDRIKDSLPGKEGVLVGLVQTIATCRGRDLDWSKRHALETSAFRIW